MRSVLLACLSSVFQFVSAQDNSVLNDVGYEIVQRENDSLLLVDSTDCYARFNRAVASRHLAKYNESVKDINFVIEVCKDSDAISFSCRAATLRKMGKYAAAINDYLKIISIVDSTVNIWSECFDIGFCYAQQERYHDALVWYSKAIANSPNQGVCYYNRGLIYYGKKEIDAACEDLRKASFYGVKEAEKVRMDVYCK